MSTDDSGLVTIKSVSDANDPSAINRDFIDASGKKFELEKASSVPHAFSSFLSPVVASPSSAQKAFISQHGGTPFNSTNTFFEGRQESMLPKYGSPGLEDYRDSRTIPFYPHWAFGMDSNTKVANLSNNKHTIVYYTVSHMGVIYNSFTNTMKFLQGHHHYITCVSHDASGKWLVSADAAKEDKDNAVIIWNTEECAPVLTIFDPHPYYGTAKLCMSPDGKYLITIGFESSPILKFWLWTYGHEKENDSFQFKYIYGAVKGIAFNQNKCEQFMVTLENEVIFFTWENGKLSSHITEVRRKLIRNYGSYVESTYVDQSHTCVSVTSNSWVFIWGIVFHSITFDSIPITNNKIFIKAIRLQKDVITTIVQVDGIFATGDTEGHVKFYDGQFKILFWVQNFKLSHINNIKFNICKRNYVFKNPMHFDAADLSVLSEEPENKVPQLPGRCEPVDDDDRSDEYEHLYKQLLPSDFTLEKAPFIVRDFIVFAKNGLIGMVDFVENTFTLLVENINAYATSICVHDEKPILCVGYSNGKIRVYNYNTCVLITTATIKSDVDKEYNGISCIRYSPHGYFLACGTTGGCIWFLETSIAQPQTETPFYYDKSEIELIQFSADNRYLAYSDASVTVSLLKRYDKEDAIPEWLFHGRFCGHTKPITDLVFTSLGRLFSLSVDSHIVEYKVKGGELGKLDILCRQPIMQTAVPLCFLVYNIGAHCNDNYFIISTNQVKDFCLSNDGKYIFTLGEKDNTCLMWMVWPRAIEIMEQRGGDELNPYYCLINGGVDGWLFHEMKDLFYYMQILYQGEDSPLPRETSRNIAISELPNIMRAIGFYPTEYELGLMLYEAKTFFCEKSETNPEEIRFENFVKLYINHRPALGITIDILRAAFDRFGNQESYNIQRSTFIDVLCNQGEEFKMHELEHCLKQLLHLKDSEVDEKSTKSELLPPEISFEEFVNDILGIEIPDS